MLPARSFSGTIFLGLLLSHSAACGQEELFEFSRPEMGTLFQIKLHANDKSVAERAADAAFARIAEINQIASDYLPESELSHFNKAPDHQAITVSRDLYALIEKSLATSKLTDGAFDITCAHAVQNWRRAKRQKKLPSPELTARAIELTDWRALQLDVAARTVTKLTPGMMIDLGGIGKGYAAHEALLVLRQHGITRAVVAGSGDLAIGDPPPGKDGWDVALRTFEKPEDSDRLIHLSLHNCGCSTAGDLHQFLELDGLRYSHIIDPKTGLGLTRRIACTIIAATAFDADALDTPLCVLGVERGLALVEKLPGCHARFVTLDSDAPQVSESGKFPPHR